MSKKLIVCADGTWNDEDGAGGQTNVAKLHRLLQNQLVEPASRQLVFYVTGVGTRFGSRIRGGAFGYGLSQNMVEAYRLLVDHYDEGDQLYFFGFSRGAYTARSLAGFIRNSGLLRREHAELWHDAFLLYRDRSVDGAPDSPRAIAFKQNYAYTPDIEFIGVWDTVGSLGIPPARFLGLRWLSSLVDRGSQFYDTNLSRSIKHAYHALSIHERRGTFPPTLWQKQDQSADQVLEQVWFPGVHCDVGGGYHTTGLSDAAFDWMVQKAIACGLRFREDGLKLGVNLAPDPLAKLHDSYSIAFQIIDWLNLTFGGNPRTYHTDPSYRETISNVARDRFQLIKREWWPPTFLDELARQPAPPEATVEAIHP